MKQWIEGKTRTESQKIIKKIKPDEPIKYVRIVDDTYFQTDKETIRNKRLNAGDASSSVPIYDSTIPTDIEIALRNGKLDKAEVSQMQIQEQKRIIEETKEKRKRAKEAIREAAIDNAIGIGQQEQAKPQ